MEVCAHLVGLIIPQVYQLAIGDCIEEQFQLLSRIHSRHYQQQLQFVIAHHLLDEPPPSMCSSVKLAQEKGASNWLSCLPLKSHKFSIIGCNVQPYIIISQSLYYNHGCMQFGGSYQKEAEGGIQ